MRLKIKKPFLLIDKKEVPLVRKWHLALSGARWANGGVAIVVFLFLFFSSLPYFFFRLISSKFRCQFPLEETLTFENREKGLKSVFGWWRNSWVETDDRSESPWLFAQSSDGRCRFEARESSWRSVPRRRAILRAREFWQHLLLQQRLAGSILLNLISNLCLFFYFLFLLDHCWYRRFCIYWAIIGWMIGLICDFFLFRFRVWWWILVLNWNSYGFLY